jgi:hypothetical protein
LTLQENSDIVSENWELNEKKTGWVKSPPVTTANDRHRRCRVHARSPCGSTHPRAIGRLRLPIALSSPSGVRITPGPTRPRGRYDATSTPAPLAARDPWDAGPERRGHAGRVANSRGSHASKNGLELSFVRNEDDGLTSAHALTVRWIMPLTIRQGYDPPGCENVPFALNIRLARGSVSRVSSSRKYIQEVPELSRRSFPPLLTDDLPLARLSSRLRAGANRTHSLP